MSSIESKFLTTVENCDMYRGKWIAITGNKIIADGENLTEVYQNAMKGHRNKTPLFHRIPETSEEQILLL